MATNEVAVSVAVNVLVRPIDLELTPSLMIDFYFDYQVTFPGFEDH